MNQAERPFGIKVEVCLGRNSEVGWPTHPLRGARGMEKEGEWVTGCLASLAWGQVCRGWDEKVRCVCRK